ncbi:phage tail protein [Aeromonas bestiarum]|uniref:Phage tail protein n=1 Tax=Aeromonas bestiarum TaxID=105751 RepID=A0ABT7PVR1_9GAMM|nr:phage tail protein [Aeromonas bestiarum]MDM5071178.1 phage tail protein [Aeromonas bestiarum]
MANLQEVVSWDAGVYQLETGDSVLGGPGGTSNKQAQALANRTAYLKQHVDDIEGGVTAAGKADKLTTARNVAIAGDVTGQASFDGSTNITITVTYKNSGVAAGTYRSVTVDAKGNITAGTNPTTLVGYGITDAVPTSQKGAVNGVATLDGGGKVPVSQLPATAIVDTFVVGSQAAMLALTAEIGDVAVRTDLNKTFILRVAGASTLANWQELLTPTDSVQSVDGMTGAVTIATATEALKGKAQIATQAEVNTGTDDTKFVTAKKLLAWVKQATETVLGMMKVATQVQTDAGTADDVAITPKKLRFGFSANLSANGYIAFPSWLGGLIFQWFEFNVTNGWTQATASGTSTPVWQAQASTSLPMAFPTNSFGALPVPVYSAQSLTWGPASAFVTGRNTTTLTVSVLSGFNPSTSMTIRAFCIGN